MYTVSITERNYLRNPMCETTYIGQYEDPVEAFKKAISYLQEFTDKGYKKLSTEKPLRISFRVRQSDPYSPSVFKIDLKEEQE